MFNVESIGKVKGSPKDHVMSLGLMNQAHQALRFQDLSLTLIITRPIIHEEKYCYNSSQMPLQTQQPQPRTEIFQTPQQTCHCPLSLYTVLGMKLEVRV